MVVLGKINSLGVNAIILNGVESPLITIYPLVFLSELMYKDNSAKESGFEG